MSTDCIFCNYKDRNIILEGDFIVAFWDEFPVSKGHILIAPKRHVESLFDLKSYEINEIYSIIKKSKAVLEETYNPDGYNIGINEGRAAGRTIDHVHIHIIPRYGGDVEDPRGGIRGVIPSKKDY